VRALSRCTHKPWAGSFNVRNRHLTKLLEEKGENTDDVWSSIVVNGGSVQHLECLTDDEKDVYKTAFEMDQRWIIEHAGDRAGFIDQAQSVNVFLPADVHKRDLHQIHFQAWKKGVKSLYYCRSLSIQRAEKDEATAAHGVKEVPLKTLTEVAVESRLAQNAPATGENIVIKQNPAEMDDYDECLACQ
jgi:ribonucleoside-diphosphate reductase alpha chain